MVSNKVARAIDQIIFPITVAFQTCIACFLTQPRAQSIHVVDIQLVAFVWVVEIHRPISDRDRC